MTQEEPVSGAASTGATSVAGTWAWRAKSAYAAAAHGVGRALVAVKVWRDPPPTKDQRIKHWLTSLTRVHDSLAIAELDVPWWTYRAIDVVEAWLSAHPRPIRVFEWGSGASTFWVSKRADEVFSVEHHAGFAAMMRPELGKLGNVTFIEVAAPERTDPRIGSGKMGSEHLDFHDYVHAIDDIPGEFDLVIVDGRAREECMRAGSKRLAPGGILVFDNSHRQRYKDAIAASGLHEQALRGLTPTLPYPDRTSVLTVPSS